MAISSDEIWGIALEDDILSICVLLYVSWLASGSEMRCLLFRDTDNLGDSALQFYMSDRQKRQQKILSFVFGFMCFLFLFLFFTRPAARARARQ